MLVQNVLIEIQYFDGCPNSEEIKRRVKEAILQVPFEVNYKEVLVETDEDSNRLKFRGSPTILINGSDLEKMPESLEGNLACRRYINGLPTIEEIKSLIEDINAPNTGHLYGQ